MKSLDLNNNVTWIGAVDHKLRVFDIIMETEFGTSYNSYLVKGSEKTAVIETVKEKFFDEYLEKLKKEVELDSISYIVVNHTEPDHAGSVGRLLKYAKNATVVGSKAAINYLKEIINEDFPAIVANVKESISLGDKTLRFISAPFLHWPDSMYTYVEECGYLFTCDSFGSHYATDKILFSKLDDNEIRDYKIALKYYYDAIFSPFKKYVLKAISQIKTLDIKMILNGHGPVLDTNFMEIVDQYKEWSEESISVNNKKVVIPYVSAYGYTEEAAMFFKEELEKEGDIEVVTYDVNISNFASLKSEIVKNISDAKGVLIGSVTINSDALPIVWDIANSINPVVHAGKVSNCFGSFGWSGEGVDNINVRLKQLKQKGVEGGFKFKFRLSDEDKVRAREFIKQYIALLNS